MSELTRVSCPSCGYVFTPSRKPASRLSEEELRNRWLDNYSQSTRTQRNNILTRFCEINGTDAVKVIEEDRNVIIDFLIKFYKQREAEKAKAPTISKDIRRIMGYLESSGVYLTGLPKLLTKRHDNAYPHDFLPTHDQVRAMIRTQDQVRNKAVICFLAQTGQRDGFLTGLKWKMIDDLPDGWSLVTVPPTLPNRLGVNQNKNNRQYKFLVHPETMTLIRQMPKETDYVWNIAIRTMEEIVGRARDEVPELREDPEPDALRVKHYRFTPHTFRSYWMECMYKGGVDETIRQYLLGHKIRDEGTYHRGLFTKENLVKEYKKAEPYLGGLLVVAC